MPTLTRYTIIIISALSMSFIFGEDVFVEISNYNDGTLEIYLENSADVGGFQFNVGSSFGDFTVNGASGGRAGDAGFMMSSSPNGTVLGFSMTGAVIPSGSGTLCNIAVTFSGEEGSFSLSSPVFSNASGQAMSVALGSDYDIGGPELCEDVDACNYGAEGECEYIADSACDCEGHVEDCAGECDGSLEFDDCGVCGGDNSECLDAHFEVDLPNTGESSLIIFENGISTLEVGDEIGLFDASGITEGNDACDGSFDGEVLVGAGTWDGNQLEITATGSVDMCQFGGSQLAGYVGGNDIVAKVWDVSEEMEYSVALDFSMGNGTYGSILTSVSEIHFAEAHFNVELPITGESSLIVFESTISTLEVGDEIGLFDASGITEANDACDGSYDGEVLVGAGTWTGSQLEIVTVGSVDMCDFGGGQLAGYISGNSIITKVWDASEELETEVNLTYSTGNGNYGSILTAVSEISVGESYNIVVNEFFFRAASGTSVPDYIELYNASDNDVDLSGWMINDEDGVISNGTIPAWGYFLLSKDDPFFNADADELFVGEDIENSTVIDFNLSTSSGTISLLDADGNEVDYLHYSVGSGWPVGNTYRGHSVELLDWASDNSNSASWYSSNGISDILYGEDGSDEDLMNFGTPNAENEESGGTDDIVGCMDETSCNYNSEANVDCGDCCEYPVDNYDCEGNCIVDIDCAGDCGGNAELDVCGVCDGEGIPAGDCDCFGNIEDCAGVCGGDAMLYTLCEDTDGDGLGNPGTEVEECIDGGRDITDGCDLPDLNISLNADGSVEFNSSLDIGGFQFTVEGTTINTAQGGAAANAGFMISGGGSTVLGFSMQGLTIPAGCGTLVELTFNGEATGLTDLVFSDASGNAIPFNYYIDEGPDLVADCSDEYPDCAANYYDCADECGGFSELDDCEVCNGGNEDMDECGVCFGSGYTDECGICDDDASNDCTQDCNGDWGGSAELDECGICDGPGAIYACGCEEIPDGACDCEGNVFDECGVCGGDGTACQGVDVDVAFSNGWNWFSLNVFTDDMSLNSILSSLDENAVFIKNQTTFADYYAGWGWFGTVGEFTNYTMYRLLMNDSDNLVFSGEPANVANNPFDLSEGWNWVSYTPQNPNDINTALASIEGSAVFAKNQTTFSDYYDGWGWFGTLNTLQGFEGYMIQMSEGGTLEYPEDGLFVEESTNGDWLAKVETELLWDVNPYDFEFNGSITAMVKVDGVDATNEDNILYAFSGNECRGEAKVLYFPPESKFVYPLMVFGHESGEKLTFKLYNSLDGSVVNLAGNINFVEDMTMGNAIQTVNLQSIDLPDNFVITEAYPNPFNPSTTFGINIPNEAQVSVGVYNVNGQLLETIHTGILSGYQEFTWNANDVSSGIYIIQAISEKNVSTQKVMLLK